MTITSPFYRPLSTKCLSLILDVFSTIPAASAVSATTIPFAHQDALDGKQPGPSLLLWPAGYKFVLKHCSEAVGMAVKFGNAHPSDVPVKDLQMNLLLDNFPIPLKHKLTR